MTDQRLYRVSFSSHIDWASDGTQIIEGHANAINAAVGMIEAGYRVVSWEEWSGVAAGRVAA